MNQKKKVLTDKQIQTTIDIVKLYWPQYTITTGNIRNPTKDFVLKFFADCIHNMDGKCSFVMKQDALPQPVGFSQEEIMYWKLSKIPPLVNEGFKLGDLYTFEPKRLNKLMFVTIHFLLFSESVIDKMLEVSKDVFEAKEKVEQDKEEVESKKQEKMEKQIILTYAKEENKQLTKFATSIAPIYEETLHLIEMSKEKCRSLETQVQKLKTYSENLRDEIEKLKKTEELLKSKVISETDYMKLQRDLDSLISDDQSLEDIQDNNGLLQHKQNIEHLRMCIQELDSLQLRNELLKLADLRVQLKSEQQNLKYHSVAQENENHEINQLNKQLELETIAINVQKKSLQADLIKTTEEAILEENNTKAKYKAIMMKKQQEIENLERDIAENESECDRLYFGFQKKFEQACKMQEELLNRFESVSMLFKQNTLL